jgi:hypothetical protein
VGTRLLGALWSGTSHATWRRAFSCGNRPFATETGCIALRTGAGAIYPWHVRNTLLPLNGTLRVSLLTNVSVRAG